MRELDPRIHPLLKTLLRKMMAGSSQAMTLQFVTVPTLQSGMKNAAPRPGHKNNHPGFEAHR
jgi:hypothetical protein